MNALISGRSGVALVVDGDQLASMHIDEPGRLIPRDAGEIRFITGEGRDFCPFENVSREEIAEQLILAREREEALMLALILLDSKISDKLRREVAGDLSELLERREIEDYVESVLYAEPLPDGGDLPGGLKLAREADAAKAQTLLELFWKRQYAIAAVREAWDAMPSDTFDGERKRWQAVAVREGLFRSLVLLYEAGKDVSEILLIADKIPAVRSLHNCRVVLRHWISPFVQYCKEEGRIPLPKLQPGIVREPEIEYGEEKSSSAPDAHHGTRSEWPDRPSPRYPSPEVRDLSQALREAYRQRAELEARGSDTTALTETVLNLRRKIREGGQLKAGDFLLDGRIELLEPIGRGGFAQVWKAYDESERAVVAVKVLHGQFAEDRTRRERFFRGARRTARLRHPGIERIIEEECEDGGHHFFVMELASGGDLRQAVLLGRLTREERLRIILDVGKALAFAHKHGVVHRDVKPGNVLLDASDRPKLTDFDLVRAADTTGGTRTTMLDTFPYAAPEAMVDAKQAAVPADVYGLGMTAIFALHGADLPADVPELVAKLEVGEGCRKALLRAVARKLEDRWTTVTELCQALQDEIDEKPPAEARPPLIADDDYDTLALSGVRAADDAAVARRGNARRRWRKPSEVSEEELLAALKRHRFELKATAEALGVSRTSLYDLLDRSPNVRSTADVPPAEIRAAYERHGGDLKAMVTELEVSERALRQRLKDLGLRPKGWG